MTAFGVHKAKDMQLPDWLQRLLSTPAQRRQAEQAAELMAAQYERVNEVVTLRAQIAVKARDEAGWTSALRAAWDRAERAWEDCKRIDNTIRVWWNVAKLKGVVSGDVPTNRFTFLIDDGEPGPGMNGLGKWDFAAWDFAIIGIGILMAIVGAVLLGPELALAAGAWAIAGAVVAAVGAIKLALDSPGSIGGASGAVSVGLVLVAAFLGYRTFFGKGAR